MSRSSSTSGAASLSANPNLAWAGIFVEELARSGLRAVCIAPGSRSTPLTLAFFAHPSIHIYRHLDERSAAFFALGLALEQDAPVALVCTSGTATANFHPAVIEAFQSQVPLLVLTADRPPELRHSGANQTIDQVKMFGDHVLWSLDVALPEKEAPAVAERNLRTLAARVYARANGLPKGPVHVNFPFRKPLEPAGEEIATWRGRFSQTQPNDLRPFTRISRGRLMPTPRQVAALREIIQTHQRGMIVCGPRCPGEDFPAAVSQLSRQSGYPLLADPLSGVRFGPHIPETPLVGGYDTFLAGDGHNLEEPEVVIRFGGVPTSKALNSYLEAINPVHRIHISHTGVWADDSHRMSEFWHVDPAQICRQAADQPAARTASPWLERILATEAACWQAMTAAMDEEFFDGAAVAHLAANLPQKALLFVGNSLPVRHLDQFGRPRAGSLRVFGNRGASGIDGNISTALGIGVAGGGPLVALVGDITFYHDMNGLLAVKPLELKPTIVLLNNHGGGIFRRLPIAHVEPPFTELFLTPHQLDFEPVARMYGCDFLRVTDGPSFERALAESIDDPAPRVIEVSTDNRHDYDRRLAVIDRVSDKLTGERSI